MNQPWVYICPPSWTPPSYLPPHPIPQGHPRAPSLSALSRASNLDWRSISHMVVYMFQCYLSNHPTLTFSHRIQNSLHLCLFCCLTYRVIVSVLKYYNDNPQSVFFPPSVLLGTWWLGLFNLKTHMPPPPRNQFYLFANFLLSIFPVPFLDVLLAGFWTSWVIFFVFLFSLIFSMYFLFCSAFWDIFMTLSSIELFHFWQSFKISKYSFLVSKDAFFIVSFWKMDAISSLYVCLIKLYWNLGNNRW